MWDCRERGEEEKIKQERKRECVEKFRGGKHTKREKYWRNNKEKTKVQCKIGKEKEDRKRDNERKWGEKK